MRIDQINYYVNFFVPALEIFFGGQKIFRARALGARARCKTATRRPLSGPWGSKKFRACARMLQKAAMSNEKFRARAAKPSEKISRARCARAPCQNEGPCKESAPRSLKNEMGSRCSRSGGTAPRSGKIRIVGSSREAKMLRFTV